MPEVSDVLADFEEDRLDPSDPSIFLLTPKARRFARQQARQRRRLEMAAVIQGIPVDPVDRGAGHNFLKMLEQLDRPRNAVHNAILGGIEGDTDTTLQNLIRGWTFEERAHFEDILDAMGAEAGLVRKIAGFAGDVVVDPLNLIPASLLAKAAKGTKLSGVFDKAVKWAGQNAALRQSVVRWSGIEGMDEVFMKSLDVKGFHQQKMMEAYRPIALRLRDLKKNLGDPDQGVGIMTRLGEEGDLSRVREFIDERNAGALKGRPIEEVDELIEQGGEFRNPSAIRELTRMIPEEQQKWLGLADEYQAFNTRWLRKPRENAGQVIPQMDTALPKIMATIDGRMDELIRKRRRRLAAERKVAAKSAKAGFQASRKALREAGVGSKEVQAALKEAEKRAKDTTSAIFEGEEEAIAALDEMSSGLDPELLGRLKKVVLEDYAKTSSAARYYDQRLMASLVESMSPDAEVGRKYAKMLEDRETISLAMQEIPSWVHHIVTPEAEGQLLDAFKRRKTFRSFFADPQTSDTLHRAFVKKMNLNYAYGREATAPLSFDEVERAIRESGLPSKFAKTERGASPDEALRKRRTPIEVIRKEAPAVARFFDVTDEEVVATSIQDTARSLSASEYLNEVSRIFGKTIEDVGEEEFSKLFALNEATNPTNIYQLMPDLQGVRFSKEVFEEVNRRWEHLANPSKALKGFDDLQGWWKSYTLFMFPWYHTRNAIGDHLNMMSGGFLDRPTDIMHSVKAGILQWNAMRGNSQAARRVMVHLKDTDEVIDGNQVLDLALRNGVLNSGWMMGNVPDEMRRMGEPFSLGIKSFLPDTKNFAPLRAGVTAGEYLENQRRLTFFIHRLERGDEVRTAAARVKTRLGDYRSEIMTPLERDFGTRVFPFMRFNRFNIPLQIENMMNVGSRAKIMAILRGQQALTEDDLDATDLPEYVPEWIRSAAGVPIRRNPDSGELDFWLLKGWHPAAELDNILSAQAFGKMAINQLSPLIKAPIEMGAGVSLYKGDKIPEDVEFLGRQMDGRTVNLLRNLRLLVELDRYDPLGTFRVLRRGPGSIGESLKKAGMATVAGGAPQTISPAREQLSLDDERVEYLKRRISVIRRTRSIQEGFPNE